MRTVQPSFVTRRKAARATFPLKKGEGMKERAFVTDTHRARFRPSAGKAGGGNGDSPVTARKKRARAGGR